MEWTHKRITLIGMWLASLAGAVYGLLFTIIGAGFDWGPGGSMNGPYWKIVLIGLVSIIIGMYAGELIVRKMAGIVHKKPRSKTEIIMLMGLSCAVGSLIAWILSWEIGFIGGVMFDVIPWEDTSWGEIIMNVGLMSAVFGMPIAIGTGIIEAIVASFLLRRKSGS